MSSEIFTTRIGAACAAAGGDADTALRHALLDEACKQFEREPGWVEFYRNLLGVGGLVDLGYPDFQSRREFERSEEFREIQRMLRILREQNDDGRTRTKVRMRTLTVRMPRELYDSLQAEAHRRKQSLNRLAIDRLLQTPVEDDARFTDGTPA